MANTTDDDKRKAMLERIRALMARTTAAGFTEAEAKEAAAKVDALMAAYEIDLTELTIQDQELVKIDIKLEAHPVRYAATAIADFCDCKVWTEGPFISFLGLEIDTEIAEYVMLMFQRAIDREVTQFKAFDADLAMMDLLGRHHMAESFKVGMAVRLGERLKALKSKRDFTQRASGFDLVVSKQALVNQGFATLGITLGRTGGGRSVQHVGAYNAGRSAADKVSINQGVGRSAPTGRVR